MQEEATGRLAPGRRVVVHPQPAFLLRPGLHHELRPRARAAAPVAEPPVVHVPHDVDHLPVGQHGGAVAPESPADPPHLRHLLAVDGDPQLPFVVPAAPARVHGHLVLVPALPEPAARDVRGRRAPQLLAPADEERGRARGDGEAAGELARRAAGAEEERELGVGHDGEAVVALGLRGRRRRPRGVLGLRGVPVHADGRAGAGDQRPAPSLLPCPRRRVGGGAAAIVEGDRDAGHSRRAPGPRHPDQHLLARGQHGSVHAGGGRLQRPVQRPAAGDGGGRRDAHGAVAEAGQLPHRSPPPPPDSDNSKKFLGVKLNKAYFTQKFKNFSLIESCGICMEH
ncbi:hypothetical protein BDA96_07G182800 [Sorghum bicolor]|uniref:PABS domain-containing protein n=1 Tax=Sorghum bicolor TaxID=4558 RepID=A0A921UA46_SORBI|nr:hypothetical protein BDA96_07G182800 [Sorghum bicolor]